MIRRLFVFPVFPPEAKERACQTWLGKRELVLRKVILVDASLEGRIQFFLSSGSPRSSKGSALKGRILGEDFHAILLSFAWFPGLAQNDNVWHGSISG